MVSNKKLASAAAVGLGSVVMPLNAHAAVVINELYTFGGAAGALYQNDYVELFNNDLVNPATISGDVLQYGASTGYFGTNTFTVFTLPTATIAPGGYYLIGGANGGTNGATLAVNYDTGALNMAQTSGKVRLLDPTATTTIDLVGYGTATATPTTTPTAGFTGPGFETADATSPTATLSISRLLGVDTNNNSLDFSRQTPSPTAGPVPEPATLGLLAAAGMLFVGRRKK